MDPFKIQFQLNQLTDISHLSLADIPNAAAEADAVDTASVNDRLDEIQDKINEILSLGHLSCFHH